MAISPWTKPLDMKIAPLPFEALAYGYEKRAKREEEADKGFQDLSDNLLKINAIPADAQRRDELVGQFQNEVRSLVDSYGVNNLQAALPAVKNLNRKLQYELTYGEMGAINSRHKGYQESVKKTEEAVAQYMKSGGKEGLNPEDAQQHLSYELGRLNATPIKKTASGTWETYNTMPANPYVDMQKEAFNIAKEMKPEVIESRTGLKLGPHGYLYDAKGTKKMLASDYIQSVVQQTMSTDPRIQQYLDYKHTIAGNKDAWAKALQENPYGIPSPDGMSMENPETWVTSQYYSPIQKVAKNAGNVYRQYEYTTDMDYKEDWQSRDAAKEAKERSLYSFPLPAQTIPGAMENVPAATQINPDGSIQGGEEKADTGFINKVGTLLSPVKDVIDLAVVRMMDPGLWMGVGPSTKAGKKAVEEMKTSNQNLKNMVTGQTKSKQQLIEEQADKVRQEFPEVAQMFPKTSATKPGKDGTTTYDANAGKAINFVHDAIQNSTTVIGNMMTPESPKLIDEIQKRVFGTNVFNKITYKLANGELGTKSEADEELGFEDGVPQEALDKAVFNGYGGFLNPGALYAQMPNNKGIPQDIIIEPDNTTKQLYTHSRMASDVFKKHKADKQVVQEPGPNNTINTFIFKYTPYITPDGTYSVKMEKYEYKNGKEGKFIGYDDAMNVYQSEHMNWLQYNSFNIK